MDNVNVAIFTIFVCTVSGRKYTDTALHHHHRSLEHFHHPRLKLGTHDTTPRSPLYELYLYNEDDIVTTVLLSPS